MGHSGNQIFQQLSQIGRWFQAEGEEYSKTLPTTVVTMQNQQRALYLCDFSHGHPVSTAVQSSSGSFGTCAQ